MNQTFSFKTGIIITLLLLSYGVSLGLVSAHGDEVHDEAHSMQRGEMSVDQMEQMINVLKQLVAALTLYKAQYGPLVPTPQINDVAPEATHHEEMHHEEEQQEDPHEGHGEALTPVARLVIEVEPHGDKTHVHVRYTDKPEEMFFVDAQLNDEDGIVGAIVAKTGLGAYDTRTAIKYTQ